MDISRRQLLALTAAGGTIGGLLAGCAPGEVAAAPLPGTSAAPAAPRSPGGSLRSAGAFSAAGSHGSGGSRSSDGSGSASGSRSPGSSGSSGSSSWSGSPGGWGAIRPGAGPGPRRVINIVAHPDDDLLFLSPDLITDLTGGAAVRTVFATAGDAGRDSGYWRGRMRGIQAAYAQMLDVPDSWAPARAALPGVQTLVLTAAPAVTHVYLKLPDGGPGHGYPSTGHSSLQQLWMSRQPTVAAIDGGPRYSLAGLIAALAQLIGGHHPDVVRTQAFTGRFGDGDHGDHHAVAFMVARAVPLSGTAASLIGYHDYETDAMPANVTGAVLAAKRAAFFAYAGYDDRVCGSVAACGTDTFGAWLTRQYRLAGTGRVARAGAVSG